MTVIPGSDGFSSTLPDKSETSLPQRPARELGWRPGGSVGGFGYTLQRDTEKERRNRERRVRQSRETEERLAKEKEEQERLAKEMEQQERLVQEKEEQERIAKEKEQQERLVKEKAKTKLEQHNSVSSHSYRLVQEKEQQETLAKQTSDLAREAHKQQERAANAILRAKQRAETTEAVFQAVREIWAPSPWDTMSHAQNRTQPSVQQDHIWGPWPWESSPLLFPIYPYSRTHEELLADLRKDSTSLHAWLPRQSPWGPISPPEPKSAHTEILGEVTRLGNEEPRDTGTLFSAANFYWDVRSEVSMS
ncbi:hypothetical protein BDV96DRAFT_651283 [Lophiotrema nucula]|uniref:Uncharacterized protein n=1 Tax=Lophiotrema nucula TaxID=690887 RepID=A0A6A5YSK7_9PLEO|nr:hypothetical protein BDV96DRAFT_651283 [Lophiotrema nucula]